MRLQYGATLAITLILLFLVTLLGVSAMQVTHMQEKMSSNLQDKELSFNAAETGLAAGEVWILGQTRQPSVQATCSSFPCVQETFQNLNFTTQTSSWWQQNAAAYSSPLDNIATSPRYVVEFLQFIPDSPVVGSSSAKSTGTFYYQITSRGTGTSNNSVSIIQSTTGRRY
jgi:type IV pilus assembly protein PilX